MVVKHVAVSLITNNFRSSGKSYVIITDLRSNRIKFVGDDMEVHSTDDKKSFKILDKKYIPEFQFMMDKGCYCR